MSLSKPQNGLLLLCEAAAMVSNSDSYTPSPTAKRHRGRSYQSEQVSGNSKVNATNIMENRKFFSEHVESLPDELNINFIYKCRSCGFVTESRIKAISKIRMESHILLYHDFSPNSGVPTKSNRSEPYVCELNSASKVSKLKANPDLIQLDHNYVVKCGDRMCGDRMYDDRMCDDSEGTSEPELDESDSVKTQVLPAISTPSYPHVYTPYPFEAAAIVEFNSRGEPTRRMGPAEQPLTSEISEKAAKNKSPRSKFVPAFNTQRCALECVENRVTCKPSTSYEKRDAIVPDNNVENAENVRKNVKEIALREIQYLKEAKKFGRSRQNKISLICQICNASFTARTSLINHYNSHLNLKPYKCDECKKRFTRRHTLNYHMMIHRNENRFSCRYCERQFRHPSHFRAHEKKHTGEKPLSCGFCAQIFKSRSTLKIHLKFEHQRTKTSYDTKKLKKC